VRFKVKEVARARGYSQYRLQKETGVDIRILRRLFRNQPETSVTTDTLDRIATVLGVDISQLVESIPEDQENLS
jgi:transcriptional regulator with XRE-family HTH domain